MRGFWRGACTGSHLRLPDPVKVLTGEQEAEIAILREDEVYVLFASLGAGISRMYQQHVQSGRRNGLKLTRAMHIYVQLCEQTAQHGKLDAAYIPIRRLVNDGMFQQALAAAHQHGEAQELARRMRQVFEHTDLADYVEALGVHVQRKAS